MNTTLDPVQFTREFVLHADSASEHELADLYNTLPLSQVAQTVRESIAGLPDGKDEFLKVLAQEIHSDERLAQVVKGLRGNVGHVAQFDFEVQQGSPLSQRPQYNQEVERAGLPTLGRQEIVSAPPHPDEQRAERERQKAIDSLPLEQRDDPAKIAQLETLWEVSRPLFNETHRIYGGHTVQMGTWTHLNNEISRLMDVTSVDIEPPKSREQGLELLRQKDLFAANMTPDELEARTQLARWVLEVSDGQRPQFRVDQGVVFDTAHKKIDHFKIMHVMGPHGERIVTKFGIHDDYGDLLSDPRWSQGAVFTFPRGGASAIDEDSGSSDVDLWMAVSQPGFLQEPKTQIGAAGLGALGGALTFTGVGTGVGALMLSSSATYFLAGAGHRGLERIRHSQTINPSKDSRLWWDYGQVGLTLVTLGASSAALNGVKAAQQTVSWLGRSTIVTTPLAFAAGAANWHNMSVHERVMFMLTTFTGATALAGRFAQYRAIAQMDKAHLEQFNDMLELAKNNNIGKGTETLSRLIRVFDKKMSVDEMADAFDLTPFTVMRLRDWKPPRTPNAGAKSGAGGANKDSFESLVAVIEKTVLSRFKPEVAPVSTDASNTTQSNGSDPGRGSTGQGAGSKVGGKVGSDGADKKGGSSDAPRSPPRKVTNRGQDPELEEARAKRGEARAANRPQWKSPQSREPDEGDSPAPSAPAATPTAADTAAAEKEVWAKLPHVSSTRLLSALERMGVTPVRTNSNGRAVFHRATGGTITLPMDHSGSSGGIGNETLKNFLKATGVSVVELRKKL